MQLNLIACSEATAILDLKSLNSDVNCHCESLLTCHFEIRCSSASTRSRSTMSSGHRSHWWSWNLSNLQLQTWGLSWYSSYWAAAVGSSVSAFNILTTPAKHRTRYITRHSRRNNREAFNWKFVVFSLCLTLVIKSPRALKSSPSTDAAHFISTSDRRSRSTKKNRRLLFFTSLCLLIRVEFH